MAVLAYPFAWVARAIGFALFGGLIAVFDRARVVLIPELCRAIPPPSSKHCRMRWRFHQLMDRTHFLLLAHILLHNPSVFNELPRKLVAEFLKRGHAVGLAKETVREKCIQLGNGK
jgi:hypothetical protein